MARLIIHHLSREKSLEMLSLVSDFTKIQVSGKVHLKSVNGQSIHAEVRPTEKELGWFDLTDNTLTISSDYYTLETLKQIVEIN